MRGSRALRSGACAILACMVMGCAESTRPPDAALAPGCAEPVFTGTYTFETVDLFSGLGNGFPIVITPDGRFVGTMPRYRYDCDGTITAEEAEALTAAINDAQLLCLGDRTVCSLPTSDTPYQEIRVTVGEGARAHDLCDYDCYDPRGDLVGAVMRAASAPMFRAFAAGECTDSTYVEPRETERCPHL